MVHVGTIRDGSGFPLIKPRLIEREADQCGPQGQQMAERPIDPDTLPTLSISTEKVCLIVLRARQFDVKDVAADADSGSNPTDDGMVDVLEDNHEDPVYRELVAFIGGLSEDEQIDLVALAWLGRGDESIEEWDKLRAEAARNHNRRTARYLLGQPLLPDFLEDGLSQFGRSCADELE
jgi:hypothetical protein